MGCKQHHITAMSIKLGGYHLTCSTLCSPLEQYQTKSYHTIKEVHPTPQNTLRYSGKIAKPLLITNTPVVHERGEYIEKLLPNLPGTLPSCGSIPTADHRMLVYAS